MRSGRAILPEEPSFRGLWPVTRVLTTRTRVSCCSLPSAGRSRHVTDVTGSTNPTSEPTLIGLMPACRFKVHGIPIPLCCRRRPSVASFVPRVSYVIGPQTLRFCDAHDVANLIGIRGEERGPERPWTEIFAYNEALEA